MVAVLRNFREDKDVFRKDNTASGGGQHAQLLNAHEGMQYVCVCVGLAG